MKDIVVFELPSGVWDPQSFMLGWSYTDSDVQAWVGGGSTTINFNNVCFAGTSCTRLVEDLGFVNIK